MPIYVPSGNRCYLAIRNDWFSEYSEDELGKIYDCYIEEFSEDYIQLKKIWEQVPSQKIFALVMYYR